MPVSPHPCWAVFNWHHTLLSMKALCSQATNSALLAPVFWDSNPYANKPLKFPKMICSSIKSGSTLYRWTHTRQTCTLAYVTDEEMEQVFRVQASGALVWEAETWRALHRLNKLESVFPCDSVALNLKLGWSQRFLGSSACLRGFSAVSLFALGGRGLVNLANFRDFLKLVKLFISLLKRASLQDRMFQFQRELLCNTVLSLNY